MKNFTDIEIIESVKKGAVGDFSALVDRYKDRAFSLLKRMLGDEMDAEEALQDAFLKAHNGLNSFRADSKFSTWFYRIAYNTALTVLSGKGRKIRMQMSQLDNLYDFGEQDEKIYAETENAKEYLFAIMNEIPPRNSIVLILYYIDGLSLKEIASVLDITLVNAKTLLHRSRNILRDALLKRNYQEEFIWND